MTQTGVRRMAGSLLLVLALGLGPRAAAQAPQIPERDRVRLAEAFRLGEELQEQVWKGWSAAPFAVLLVTPEHEFLVRHPKPTEDFQKLGYDPRLKSEIYFRKRVFSPEFLATFPAVNGVSTIVIGQAENTQAKASTRWVVTLFHEHFHQWQDSQPDFYAAVNALGLARGDTTGMWMLNFAFPYENAEVGRQFSAMSHALADALEARGTAEFPVKLEAYRAARNGFTGMLLPDDYKYFSFQTWKEGVARYTEYRVARMASELWRPSAEFQALPDFTSFSDDAAASLERIRKELRTMELAKWRRAVFYAQGAGEALLLDATTPRWQERYLAEKFFLERIPTQ